MARLGALVGGLLLVVACGGDGDDPPTPSSTPTTPTTAAVTTTTAAGTTYTVQAGDSLSAIAERFGTTVEALVEANGIANPNAIAVGQVIAVPPPP